MAESNDLTLATPRKRIHLGAPEDPGTPVLYALHVSVGGSGPRYVGVIADETVCVWVDGGGGRLSLGRVGPGETDVTLTEAHGGPTITLTVTVPSETQSGATEAHLGESF